ncbi:hypothetical protein Taro_027271 [Colocasia esculenta]|uniref:Uncharacterized protein n=1 Tax=Colocasia esculenta TaxID=4460 RepID=A0A843VJM9_COLES|nr:hypothetical protein [Colocasia esculenta]
MSPPTCACAQRCCGVLTPVVLLEHGAFKYCGVVAMRFMSEPSLDLLESFIDYPGWIISKV